MGVGDAGGNVVWWCGCEGVPRRRRELTLCLPGGSVLLTTASSNGFDMPSVMVVYLNERAIAFDLTSLARMIALHSHYSAVSFLAWQPRPLHQTRLARQLQATSITT